MFCFELTKSTDETYTQWFQGQNEQLKELFVTAPTDKIRRNILGRTLLIIDKRLQDSDGHPSIYVYCGGCESNSSEFILECIYKQLQILMDVPLLLRAYINANDIWAEFSNKVNAVLLFI